MSNQYPSSVSLPISSLARSTAHQFASEQVTIYKARCVFLNTLAVWAVHDYLALMEINTDLTQGDSWNPLMRHCADVADLVVHSGLGRLECRPVWGSACTVPPEAGWERIAYIFVKIDASSTEATLLGFLFQAEPIESGHGLLSLDRLLTYLHQVASYPSAWSRKYILLRDWLGQHDPDDWPEGWLNPQRLLAQPKLAFRWRSEQPPHSRDTAIEPTVRGKLVPLGSRLILLVVQVRRIALERLEIWVQVLAEGSAFIVEGLALKVIDASGTPILQTQARERDGMLQLRFSGTMGEIFQVVLGLDENWSTETFMI